MDSRRLLCGVLMLLVTISVTKGHGEHHHQAVPPEQRPTSFNDPKITQDEEHLREHLKDEINLQNKAKMSPEEMEFHYFRLHDTNNDTHLDGIEIMQAMAHMLPVPELELSEKLGKSKEQQEEMMKERYQGMQKYYEDMIDRVLYDDDVDKDGYLTYSEFARARRREEFHARKMHDQHMMHQQSQFEQFKQFQEMQKQMQNNPNFQPTIPPPPPPRDQNQQHGQQIQYQQQQHGQQQQQYQQPR
ncbi:putative mediator of RNA polymerase II transcription subunit 26 [Mercenaria mercenaria]|uniref:putative mediator of RNA polymerase II transcription subunit 26 n=1 Tax=Mercenaria mercenaria TaxID=6596 RepID=UPI001E1DBE5D|nr:putative mediator of RNA polymerase II transcription subunit 26 [Mercenaria mercenaria]